MYCLRLKVSSSGQLEVTEAVDSGDRNSEPEGRTVILTWLMLLRTSDSLLQTRNPPKSHLRLCFGKRGGICSAGGNREGGRGLWSYTAARKEPPKPTHRCGLFKKVIFSLNTWLGWARCCGAGKVLSRQSLLPGLRRALTWVLASVLGAGRE